MLPSGAMSLNHALAFGVISGAVGSLMLAVSINMLAASLAFSNILLYTLVYTPMKRVHPINTWIGSIVGAIPPLIGTPPSISISDILIKGCLVCRMGGKDRRTRARSLGIIRCPFLMAASTLLCTIVAFAF